MSKVSVVNSVCLKLLVLVLIACPQLVDAQSDDALIRELGGYHFTSSNQELEQIAGGSDALVSRLLELRLQEKPPFVGIRATKVLVSYAHRADVQQAFSQDMKTDSRLGIARMLVAHIDSIAPLDFRHSIARAAVERAKTSDNFRLYVRSLEKSGDEHVRRIARTQ